MKIIIVGAGNIGYYLTRSLFASDMHDIRIVEKDFNRCNLVADRLEVPVIHGDGTQIETLKKIGVEKADIVVALTGRDEDNFIISQLSKQYFNVKTTIAKANNPKNVQTMKSITTDIVVSSASMLAKLIEQEVDAVSMRLVTRMTMGDSSIVEFRVNEESLVKGKRIMDIKWPNDSLAITIIRNEESIIPSGDSTLLIGDDVLIATKEHNLRALTKLFNKH